jgi:hypothetical protein
VILVTAIRTGKPDGFRRELQSEWDFCVTAVPQLLYPEALRLSGFFLKKKVKL